MSKHIADLEWEIKLQQRRIAKLEERIGLEVEYSESLLLKGAELEVELERATSDAAFFKEESELHR